MKWTARAIHQRPMLVNNWREEGALRTVTRAAQTCRAAASLSSSPKRGAGRPRGISPQHTHCHRRRGACACLWGLRPTRWTTRPTSKWRRAAGRLWTERHALLPRTLCARRARGAAGLRRSPADALMRPSSHVSLMCALFCALMHACGSCDCDGDKRLAVETRAREAEKCIPEHNDVYGALVVICTHVERLQLVLRVLFAQKARVARNREAHPKFIGYEFCRHPLHFAPLVSNALQRH